MIKCCNCGKDAERFGSDILISQDGDFVCGEECRKEYEEKRDYFFNTIIYDDKKFNNWIDG